MAGRRTQFTGYRRGTATTTTFNPAWLNVYSQAFGAVETRARGQQLRGVSGQVELIRNASVQVRDLLKDAQTGRIFEVIQLTDNTTTRKLLVAEVWPPIPDEFDCGIIETFWTDAGFGTWAMDPDLGEMGVSGAGLTSTDPLGIPFLYQTISGEFDVFAQLKTSAGSGVVTRYVSIKAGSTNDLSAAVVGIKDDGTTAKFFHRQDTPSVNTSALGDTLASGNWGFVRLRRVGCRFAGFYATTTLPPILETDWVEIESVNDWLSFDDVRVGLAAYCDGTLGSPTIRFEFLRNWLPT